MKPFLFVALLVSAWATLSIDPPPPMVSKQPNSTPQLYNLVWYAVDTNPRTVATRDEACGAWWRMSSNPSGVAPHRGGGLQERTATPLLRSPEREGNCNAPTGQPILYLSDDAEAIRQHAYWFAAMGATGVIIDWSNLGCSTRVSANTPFEVGLRTATQNVIDEFSKETADHPRLKVVIAMRRWESADDPVLWPTPAHAAIEVNCIAQDIYNAYHPGGVEAASVLKLTNGRTNEGADPTKPLMLVIPKFTNPAWKEHVQWGDTRFDVRFANGNFLGALDHGYAETLDSTPAPCETSTASVCKVVSNLPYWAMVEHKRDPAPGRQDYYQNLISNFFDGSSIRTEHGVARLATYDYDRTPAFSQCGTDACREAFWDGLAQNSLARSIEPFYSFGPQVLSLHSFNYAVGGHFGIPDEGISLNSALMMEPSEELGYNILNQVTQYLARARNLTTQRPGIQAETGRGIESAIVFLSVENWPLEYRVSQSEPSEAAEWRMVKPHNGSFGVQAGASGAWYVQTRNSFGAGPWFDVNNPSVAPSALADFLAKPVTNLATASWPGYSGQFGLDGDIPFIARLDPPAAPVRVVYRPSNQHWYFNRANNPTVIQFGSPGDMPQIVNRNGVDRVSIYRPSDGTVHISTDNTDWNGSNEQVSYGSNTLIPAAVSAVVSGTSTFQGRWNGFSFGVANDVPLLIELMPRTPRVPVVFRPLLNGFAEWHIQQAGYGDYAQHLDRVVNWGLANDQPRIVFWNGAEHLAVCRGSYVYANTNNKSWDGSNISQPIGPC